MKNRTAISRQLALLIVPLIATLTIYGQSVNSFDCPIITKRNNGNGSASSGPGTFINESGQPSNPVAPNVTATSYKNVPYTFSQKTGNITFEWVTPTPSLSMGLPIINRVWLTASGVTTLMTVKFGPPAPAYLSGGKYYTFYHFYNQNIPPQGTLTLEFVDPVTQLPIKLCQYNLTTGVTTSEVINCAPTITTQPANQRVCGTGAATFTVVASGVNTYKWQVSADGSTGWSDLSNNGTYSGVSTATLTITNPTTVDGNYYRVVLTGIGTCGSTNSTAALLTAKPSPTALFASTSICGSGTQSLTVNLTGTAPWSVTYSDGTTTVTKTNITSSPWYLSGTSGKTYTITSVSDANCTNASPTGNVAATINPVPAVTPSNATTCYGTSSFSLSYTSTGSANQYSITKGVRQLSGFTNITNSALTASPLSVSIPSNTAAGVYDFYITLSSSATGCSSVAVPFTVTVASAPTMTAVASNNTVCIGSAATLTAAPSGLSSYSWTAGSDPTVIATTAVATPTVAASTTYTVRGTNASGCSATANVSITGQSGPSLTVGASASTICSGNATVLSASGSDAYTWSPSTGLSSTSGDVVTANPTVTTTYTVTSQNLSGCQSVGSVTVTVNTAAIGVTASGTICAGATRTLTATGGSTYLWYPSTGLYTDAGATVAYTGTSVTTVYAKPASTTTYYVQGTTAQSCTGIASSTVTISPAPVSGSSTTSPQIFCTQGTTTFPLTVITNQAITSAGWAYSSNGTTYTNFSTATVVGGGATATPTSSGSSPNITYTCTLSGYGAAGYTGAQYFRLVINGSSCTYNYDINIVDTKSTSTTPAPSTSQATICSGNSTVLTIGSLASGSTAQWQSSPNNSAWTDISGATSASYTASPATSTYYRVLYNGGTGNCGSTTSSTLITVASALTANTLSPSTTCTDGVTPVTLTGSAITGGIYQWQMSTTSAVAGFSDVLGATSQNYTLPSNIVSATTWYRRIASTSNCSINYSTAVAVYAPISNNQITNSAISYCVSAVATALTVTSPAGGDGSYTYQWKSSSDGTSFSNIGGATSATYTTPIEGTTKYYERSVSTGGCTDISNRFIIRVYSNPTVSVSSGSSICAGTSVNLSASGASTYSWSPATELSAASGATVTANATSTRTYIVTGTDGNGCTNTANVTITVTALPSNPTLSSSSQTICSGSSVNLTSKVSSVGTTEWFTAPEANGAYAVSTPTAVSAAGTYYVFAKSGSCYSSGYQSFTLTVDDVTKPVVNAISLSYCSPATADLTALQPVAAAGTTLKWYTVSSNPVTELADATAVGNGTYYLYAYSSGGSCFGPASDAVTVTINSLPSAATITASSEAACAPATFDLSDNFTSAGGNTYKWYSSNTVSPDNLLAVPTSVSQAGTYYVVATNASGCQGPVSDPVTVSLNSKPTSAILETTDLCGNYTGSITATSDAGSPSYAWETGIYDGSNWNWSAVSNGAVYSGSTTSTLGITNASLSVYGNQYRCTVTESGCATTSLPVLLATQAVPSTVTCPTDSTTLSGTSKAFTISYTGVVETIQWQVSTTSPNSGFSDISDGPLYSGVNDATLLIKTPTTSVDGYYYRAVLSNTCGSVQCASGARLTVSGLLPVQWMNFSARKQNATVVISWSTAAELNSRLFILQHSTNGTSWSEFGTVAASGNSTAEMNYSFVHTQPVKGSNYYRILARDADGKNSISKVIRIDTDSDVMIQLYPNPVTDGSLTVQLGQPSFIRLFDNTGRLVKQQQGLAGTQLIDLSRMAKGIYILKTDYTTSKVFIH